MCKRMLHLLKHNKLNYRLLYLKERFVCNKFLAPSKQGLPENCYKDDLFIVGANHCHFVSCPCRPYCIL